MAVNAAHLLSRNSRYIDGARSFLSRYGTRNTIVAGHSLGGFIAITMAFHFSLRVVAINPPWMINFFSSAIDQYEAITSESFRSSKIIVYQSNTDVVTAVTHRYRIQTSNINFIHIGNLGWHNMDPIIANFRRTRRYMITW